MAFGTGWFVREGGQVRSLLTVVDLLSCDRAGASYMLPLGAVRIGGRLFWLAQFSGWDHERFAVLEIKAKTVEAVLSVWGGGCDVRARAQTSVVSRSRQPCVVVGRRVRRSVRRGGVALVALIWCSGARAFQASETAEPLWDTGTFSILGYDPATGEVGGAVQSRVFSVGNGVLWADASVGVAATQAIVDVSYGPQALELLRQGLAPDAIVKQIWEADPDPLPDNWSKQGRQFAVMNLKGEYAAFTGPKATEWAGHKGGKYATAQGNILAGPAVVSNMVEAFEKTPGHLSQRLVAALEGGQAAGGDTRGQQSAAIVIVKKNCGVWLHNDTIMRLQVDDNPEPIKELKRLVEMWNTRKPRSVSPECRDVGHAEFAQLRTSTFKGPCS